MKKRVRINLSMSEDDVELLDYYASRMNLPRTTFANSLLCSALNTMHVNSDSYSFGDILFREVK